MDDGQLRTIWQQRQFRNQFSHLSGPMTMLIKHTLAKRAKQVGALAEIWDEVIPAEIAEHSALDSFHQGVLTVMVDSAPRRFELQTLLTGGLMAEIRSRFTGALNKIRVVPGQFYSVDVSGSMRYQF